MSKTWRVLVCGGRDYTKAWLVFQALERLWREHDRKLVVIEGGARGADRAAATWAEAWAGNGVEHLQFKADWKRHGNSAGPIRNRQMLAEGHPNAVLTFPGGNGTRDMVTRALAADVLVITGEQYAR